MSCLVTVCFMLCSLTHNVLVLYGVVFSFSVLCCVVLCCVVLCCVVLHYVMSCHIVLCCTLCYTTKNTGKLESILKKMVVD